MDTRTPTPIDGLDNGSLGELSDCGSLVLTSGALGHHGPSSGSALDVPDDAWSLVGADTFFV